MENAKASVSFWLVLLVIFLDWMGLGLVYPMFSSMLFNQNSPLLEPSTSQMLRGWYLGILLSAMSIGQFFSGPFLGALSDQKGRKPIFLLSLALGVIGYTFCTFGVWIKSILTLMIARILVGVAAGNAAVATATIADLSNKDTKTKNFGLYSMACGVGFTIGPFLGGKLSTVSFSLPFIVSAVALGINFLLILFFFKETHLMRREVSLHFIKAVHNVKKAFQIPELRILFLVILIYGIGWSFFYEFIPVTWIADYSFDANTIGLLYAYGAGFYALSSGLLIRPIVNRFKDSVTLFYAICILGCIIISLLIPAKSFLVWIYLPIVNFFVSLIFPTYTAMISNCATKDSQGEVLGVMQSIMALSYATSPLIAGFTLGIKTNMPLILGGATLLIAGSILGIFLRKEIFGKK